MGDILQFPDHRKKDSLNMNQLPIILEYILPDCANEYIKQRVIDIRKKVFEIMNSSEESADFSMRENGMLVYDVVIDALDEPIASIDLDAVEFLLALIFLDEYNEVFLIFSEYTHDFIRTFQEYHNPQSLNIKPYDMKMADKLYQQIDELIANSDDLVSRRWF